MKKNWDTNIEMKLNENAAVDLPSMDLVLYLAKLTKRESFMLVKYFSFFLLVSSVHILIVRTEVQSQIKLATV